MTTTNGGTPPIALLVLQEAIQARLTGDATLMSMITGVFDRVPGDQVLPYLSYGSHVDGVWPTFGGWNAEAFFLMDIWSNASGDEECFTILAEVNRLLVTTPENPPLTLRAWGNVGITYVWGTILTEEEYGIRHMPLRYLCRAVRNAQPS